MLAIRSKYLIMLVEGDTEVIFYRLVKEKFFRKARSRTKNLNGNWSIEKKVLDEASNFASAHPEVMFSIAICIDRESRTGRAPIDLAFIRQELSAYSNIKNDEVLLFEAIQDIECWLFHDIDGIYEFLHTPKKNRNSAKYRPVEKLNHEELARLFKQAGKEYKKGDASENFLSNLDLEKIRAGAPLLDELCRFASKFIP